MTGQDGGTGAILVDAVCVEQHHALAIVLVGRGPSQEEGGVALWSAGRAGDIVVWEEVGTSYGDEEDALKDFLFDIPGSHRHQRLGRLHFSCLLMGHSSPICLLRALSLPRPLGGHLVVSCCADGILCLWTHSSTPRCELTLRLPVSLGRPVDAIVFLPPAQLEESGAESTRSAYGLAVLGRSGQVLVLTMKKEPSGGEHIVVAAAEVIAPIEVPAVRIAGVQVEMENAAEFGQGARFGLSRGIEGILSSPGAAASVAPKPLHSLSSTSGGYNAVFSVLDQSGAAHCTVCSQGEKGGQEQSDIIRERKVVIAPEYETRRGDVVASENDNEPTMPEAFSRGGGYASQTMSNGQVGIWETTSRIACVGNESFRFEYGDEYEEPTCVSFNVIEEGNESLAGKVVVCFALQGRVAVFSPVGEILYEGRLEHRNGDGERDPAQRFMTFATICDDCRIASGKSCRDGPSSSTPTLGSRSIASGWSDGSVMLDDMELDSRFSRTGSAIHYICEYTATTGQSGSQLAVYDGKGLIRSSAGWSCQLILSASTRRRNECRIHKLVAIPSEPPRIAAFMGDGSIAIIDASASLARLPRLLMVLPPPMLYSTLMVRSGGGDGGVTAPCSKTRIQPSLPIDFSYNAMHGLLSVLYASEDWDAYRMWDISHGGTLVSQVAGNGAGAIFPRTPRESSVLTAGGDIRLSLAANHLWGIDPHIDEMVLKFVGRTARDTLLSGRLTSVQTPGGLSIDPFVVQSRSLDRLQWTRDQTHVAEGLLTLTVIASKLMKVEEHASLGAALMAHYAIGIPDKFGKSGIVALPALSAYAIRWQDRRKNSFEREAAHALLCATADALGPVSAFLPANATPLDILIAGVACSRPRLVVELAQRRKIGKALQGMIKNVPSPPSACAADLLGDVFLDAIDLQPLLEELTLLLENVQSASAPLTPNHRQSKQKLPTTPTPQIQDSLSKSFGPSMKPLALNSLTLEVDSIVSPLRVASFEKKKKVPLRASQSLPSSPQRPLQRSPSVGLLKKPADEEILKPSLDGAPLVAASVEDAIAARETLSKLRYQVAVKDLDLFLRHLNARFNLPNESNEQLLSAVICLVQIIRERPDIVGEHASHLVSLIFTTVSGAGATRRQILGAALAAAAQELGYALQYATYQASKGRLLLGDSKTNEIAIFDTIAGTQKSLLPPRGWSFSGIGPVAINKERIAAIYRGPGVNFTLCSWNMQQKPWIPQGLFLESSKIGCESTRPLAGIPQDCGSQLELQWSSDSVVSIMAGSKGQLASLNI